VSGSGSVPSASDAATGPCYRNTISGPVDLTNNRGGVSSTATGWQAVDHLRTTGTLPPPDTGSVRPGNVVSGPVRITPWAGARRGRRLGQAPRSAAPDRRRAHVNDEMTPRTRYVPATARADVATVRAFGRASR
jgi:hypothetical protein